MIVIKRSLINSQIKLKYYVNLQLTTVLSLLLPNNINWINECFETMEIDLKLFRSAMEENKYSEKSIRSYLICIQNFITLFTKYQAEAITVEVIEKHVQYLIAEKDISKSYQKQILTSIQKYYELVLNRKLDLSSINPKNLEYKLPHCLCKADVKAMIDKTTNLKHKTIICLLYSGGLRLIELLNLTLFDIDAVKNHIHIQTKDKKERFVMLSPALSELFPMYYAKYKPKHFVFEGQKGLAYSEKSVQQVVKLAAIRAGIATQVTPHCIRHSFAAHLLDAGIDIRYVQALLGHKSIKTTENYIHNCDIAKSKIQSPLDLL